MFAHSIFILLFIIFALFFCHHWTMGERTRKASKGELERIKRLINEKARREFAQNDAIKMAEPPPRNEAAKRNHDELAVNGPDGEYLEGDLELAEWQAQKLAKQIGGHLKRRKRRKVGRVSFGTNCEATFSPFSLLEPFYKRWEKRRPISFDFAENVPENTRQKIGQALGIWQRETCLRFAEGGPEIDRLEFFDGGGCSSFVGRAGGTQGISIATPGCDFVGIIAHEIGHALGVFHEQARPDQPRHISVHYNNIPLSRWNNFQPVSDDQAQTLGLPYDPGSVMHYGPYGFASDQFRPTISTLDPHWQSTIGQRAGPSFLDFQSINEAYSCSEHCPRPLPHCQHGGYPHPNDCSRCQCPTGFSGQFCHLVQPTSCGSTIQLSTGQTLIFSPNHPSPFPSELDCIWLLKAPPGGNVFLQFVDQFLYNCEDTCDKSFVELKTGPDFRVTGYRFCCAVAPSMAFRSVGTEMVVIHSAGIGQSTDGFKARIWSDLDWKESTEGNEKPNWIDSEQFGEGGNGRGEGRQRPNVETVTIPLATTIEMPPTTMETTTSMKLELELGNWESTTTNGSSAIWTETTIKEEGKEISPSSISGTTPFPVIPSPFLTTNCSCQEWSEWSECSQMCGGCGRRKRKRQCPPDQPLCQVEERRMCNTEACPTGTNFLFNNAEFHLLWKGCCIGLFPRNSSSTIPQSSSATATVECGPLDTNENAFLRIISTLLSSQDGKRKLTNGTRENEHKMGPLLGRRRTGEH